MRWLFTLATFLVLAFGIFFCIFPEQPCLAHYLYTHNEAQLICEAFGDEIAASQRGGAPLSIDKWMTYGGMSTDPQVDVGYHSFPITQATWVQVRFDPGNNACSVALFDDSKQGKLGREPLLYIRQVIAPTRSHQKGYIWFGPDLVQYDNDSPPVYTELAHRIAASHLSGLAADSAALSNPEFGYDTNPKDEQANRGRYRFGSSASFASVSSFVAGVYTRLVEPVQEHIAMWRTIILLEIIVAVVLGITLIVTRRRRAQLSVSYFDDLDVVHPSPSTPLLGHPSPEPVIPPRR